MWSSHHSTQLCPNVQTSPTTFDILSPRLKNPNVKCILIVDINLPKQKNSWSVSQRRKDPFAVCCFFTTGTDGVHGCQRSVDVVEISWRSEAALQASLIVQAAGFRECSEGKLETKPRHAVYTKTGMRGRQLEGLLFASCKFIPIMCLQLRPVCTVCLQSGAINVIVRGCSCLRRLSYFSLPGFKWALAALLSQCFSFPNVNACLDLYRPLYTLLFFFFLSCSFFLDGVQTRRGSVSQWDVSSDVCQRWSQGLGSGGGGSGFWEGFL